MNHRTLVHRHYDAFDFANRDDTSRTTNKKPILEADSKQTDLCVYLSAIALSGWILNALFGFWWAEPVAALIMVPIIAKEGVEALGGETCDDCHSF